MAVSAAQLNVLIRAEGHKEAQRAINQTSQAVTDAGGKAQVAAGGFDAFYDSISGGAGSALRALDGVARVMGSIAIVGGVSLIAGGAKAAWDQVSAVEQATVALRAYEQDASAVDKVLQELIEYAQSDMGVLFQRQDLFAAAQGLKMYGAETGRLTDYVKIMSRSVGTGLSTWNDLNRVIGRVGATGRLAGDDFDYLRAAGFQLDDSLRNTNITFEQLFAALDRGIPANALEGQANTIRGAMIRLQSAIRNIGLEFLDVDTKTSQFVEGGLGDRLRNALFDARDWIGNFKEVAGQVGDTIVTVIETITNLVAAYKALPDPVRLVVEWALRLVTAFGALRVATSGLGLVASLTGLSGLLTRVRGLTGEMMAASRGTQSFGGAMASLVTRINPVGLAVTAVGIGLAALAVAWGRHQREVQATQRALEGLTDSYYDLHIARDRALSAGDEQTARHLDQLRMQTSYIAQMSQEVDKLYSTGFWFGTAQTPDQMAAIREQYKLTADEIERMTASQEILGATLQDNHFDSVALAAEIQNIYDMWSRELITGSQAVDMLEDLSFNTHRFRLEAEEAVEATQALSRGLDGLSESQRSFNLEMAQMRIDGEGQMADTLTRLNSLFGDNTRASSVAAEYIDFFSENVASGAINLEDYAGRIESLNFLYDQGLLTQADYDRAIMAITIHAGEAAAANAELEESLAQTAETMQRFVNVAGLDDPLSQWNLSGNVTDMSMLAMGAQRAAEALENTFRVVVGNTSAIANQVDSVNKWVQELTTAEEGLTQLDELLQANLITQTQYNAAMESATRIGEANTRVQQNVLAIQAQQAPIIAAQTEALADYIEYIAGLPAHQQRAALGWMDAATAGQAFELQALAIAAATGQMGDAGMDMAGTMIASLAMVDPYLAAVLEDMELISIGTEGEITIHWSGLQEGLSDFDRLSVMFLEFMNLVSDTPITFEMLGLEDPREKLQDIEDTTIRLNDSPVNIPIGIVEEGEGIAAGVAALVSGIRANIQPIQVPVQVQRAGSPMRETSQEQIDALRGLSGGSSSDITLTATVDTTVADEQLATLMATVDTLGSSETVVLIDADTSSAHTVLSLLEDRLGGLETRVTTTTLDANSASANRVLSLFEDRLDSYATRVTTTTLDANSASANTVLNLFIDRLDTYAERTSTTTLDANSASAHEVLRLLEDRLNGIDNSTATVYIHAIDFATSTINSVTRSLRDLDGKTATTYTDSVTRYSSQGIRGYADGGIVREPVVLVGERGPELVALPYGSEVFSNTDTMAMLRSAVNTRNANYVPVASQASGTSGTTVIEHHYDNSQYFTVTTEEMDLIKRQANRGDTAYSTLANRHSASQYGGGRR